MVGFQDSLFPFQPYVNILCCNRFQVRSDAQGHPDTFQRMPQNLAHLVKVAGELVHIGGRAVPLWHNKDKSENPCGATGWLVCPYSFSTKNDPQIGSAGGGEKPGLHLKDKFS